MHDPMTTPRILAPLALALLCAACSTPGPARREPPPRREAPAPLPSLPPAAVPNRTPPRPAATAIPPTLGARPQAALIEARLRVAEAQTRHPGWNEADGLLRLTEDAAARGDDALTLHYARQTMRRADLAVNDYYTALARAELDQIYTHTGLDNLQLSRVQYIENAIVRGDGRTAYELAGGLKEELEIAARAYRVRSGETLWQISGRKEIYGNSQLWPLIFDANRETMKSPDDLGAGKLLRIRTNPTIDEVVGAIDYARDHTPGEVFIGEIQVVEPESP